MTFVRHHWQLLALTALVFALWSTPVIAPLKILVVFFHELAHGLAAVLTGGEIVELSVNLQQGGHAITRGGNRFLTLSAGYLGSLVLGAALFLAALRSRVDHVVLGGLGATMLAVAALYVRDLSAIVFCGMAGAACLAAARFLGRPACDLILRVIGLVSLIYVPWDIFDDTLVRAHLRSDARMLAEEVGGTTMLWGGLWLILSLGVIALCLRFALERESNLALRR